VAIKRSEPSRDGPRQVLLALGRPEQKVRGTKDGSKPDWVYGKPPGKIVLSRSGLRWLRFAGYAGLGGSTAHGSSPSEHSSSSHKSRRCLAVRKRQNLGQRN
jgi:hypothetical protein